MSSTIQVGTHDVQVVDHYLAEIGSKKTPALIVTFEDERGARIQWSGWLSEKAINGTFDVLETALGWDAAADNHQITALHADQPKLAGREATIVVEEEEYEGTVRLKVRWVNPRGYAGPGPSAMDMAAAKSLSDEVRRRVLTSRGGPAPTTAPSRSVGQPAARAAAPARQVSAPRPNTAPAAPPPQSNADFDNNIPF